MTDIFPEEDSGGVAQHDTDTIQRVEVGKGEDITQVEEGQELSAVALGYSLEGGARCYDVEFVTKAPGAQTAMAVNIIGAEANSAKVCVGRYPIYARLCAEAEEREEGWGLGRGDRGRL